MSEVHGKGEFVFATSTLEESLKPGETSAHTLSFLALSNIEFTLSLSAACASAGIGTYEDDEGPSELWKAEIPVGGRHKKPARVTNNFTLNEALKSRNTSDRQQVSVATTIKSGHGPAKDDVSLKHPFRITW